MSVDHATALRLYELMALIKQCDEKFRSMISSGQIVVTYYSPRGQEAVSAGYGAALQPDDYVVTTYRGLHDHLAKGVDLPGLWAEFLGRGSGLCKGKGGPMHITDPAHGVMVTTGIVGGGLPIGVGLGLAAQQRRDGRVTVVNFGDGATNIGSFHESLNMASVWKLPVVFVCHNNRYAEHTRFEDGTAVGCVATRAASYSMPGVTVDGNDPEAVYLAATEAIARARKGDGPTLVEAVTYRFYGHIMGDDMAYMPTDERHAAMTADPVPRYRQRLVDEYRLAEYEIAALEEGIEQRITAAAQAALAAPPPELEQLFTDVYAEATA